MFRDGTDTHNHGHGDSMTNSAQWGRVGENLFVVNRPVVASSYKHSPIKFSNG